jgi:hypothetical protein
MELGCEDGKWMETLQVCAQWFYLMLDVLNLRVLLTDSNLHRQNACLLVRSQFVTVSSAIKVIQQECCMPLLAYFPILKT